MYEPLHGQPLPNPRHKLIAIIMNVVVSLLMFLFIGLGVLFLLPPEPPKNLQRMTGTVEKLERYDANWLEYIFAESSYYRIWFVDGPRVEARSAVYDLIDGTLFTTLRVGDEITVTYEQNRKNQISHLYSIEYEGVEYLRLEEALEAAVNIFNKAETVLIILIFFVLPVVAGGIGLFFINYRYAKRKKSGKV